MAQYFETVGHCSEIELGGWVDLPGVQGRTRSVECRALVPPAPMCPKDTRCNQTWHVVNTPDKVVLESVNMSLDVPYGTSFNVIACVTFTIDSGRVRMVRTCG